MDRRSFLVGLGAIAVAAPALVEEGLGKTAVGYVLDGGAKIEILGDGGFCVGDVITIAGVRAINRVSKIPLEREALFVVTATVPYGARALPIYPPLRSAKTGGGYPTVDCLPQNGALVKLRAAAPTYPI